MDYQMDYPNGLSNGLPRWTTHMDYLINYPRKRKERNITPSLFVLYEFTDPSSCCFHFVFITAAHMVASAILRHDGWHAEWWVNTFEFIIWTKPNNGILHLSMLSRFGRGGGGFIGGGFHRSHRPVVGTFDRFMAYLTKFYWLLVAILTIHKCPALGHLNRNSQLSSNAPPMPGLPPSSLTLIGAYITRNTVNYRGVKLNEGTRRKLTAEIIQT